MVDSSICNGKNRGYLPRGSLFLHFLRVLVPEARAKHSQQSSFPNEATLLPDNGIKRPRGFRPEISLVPSHEQFPYLPRVAKPVRSVPARISVASEGNKILSPRFTRHRATPRSLGGSVESRGIASLFRARGVAHEGAFFAG